MAKYEPRLIVEYKKNIVPKLMKRFSYQNVMQVPRFEKIVVNLGVGEAIQDSKLIDKSSEDLQVISGQKPLITKAKKAISNFKIREGNKIGCKVTLRRWRMYEFIDRLINIDIPRIRDFRGLSDRSFDGRGNYTLGIKEQIIFPEIDYDKIDRVRGMDITIVTSAQSDEEAYELLAAFGMPFRKQSESQDN
ncbi:50S ribosomal protein L5 [candidate division KSB1 bacterium]|nr:50S ribosomal protein L5 [candidate division KSB1 bacterium]TDI85241.1 MAG: 50S ribosomal protein L5 [Caldithrix sp.]TDI97830.1 MAG: 50S ribosomal protein L5 [Caldithrix sp.]